jgi:hypothetical protein
VKPLLGALTFAALLALYVAAPHRLPGELPTADLTVTDAPLCPACPSEGQLGAVGWQRLDGATWVTMQFAAPPRGARVVLLLDSGIRVLLVQRQDGAWSVSTSRPDTPLDGIRVASRNDRVVWRLPGNPAFTDLAVAGPTGTRLPAVGTIPARTSPPSRPNVLDAVLLLILVVGAWGGANRGLIATLGQAGAFGLVLLSIRLALVSVPQGLDLLTRPEGAFAYGVCVAGIGTFATVLPSRLVRAASAPATRARQCGLAGWLAGTSAAALGMACVGALAGMALTLGSDLVVADRACRVLEASPTAQVLVRAWEVLLPTVIRTI